MVQSTQGRRAANQRLRRRPGDLGNVLCDHVPSQILGMLAVCKKIIGRCGSYSTCKNMLQMDLRCKWKYLNRKRARRKHKATSLYPRHRKNMSKCDQIQATIFCSCAVVFFCVYMYSSGSCQTYYPPTTAF